MTLNTVNKPAYYAYMDESGEPGRATGYKDIFLVSLVLFDNKKLAEACSNQIDKIRRQSMLPDGYEFHYSSNTLKAQNRLIDALPEFNFKFYTVVIKKDSSRSFASCKRMAEELVALLPKDKRVRIKLDNNPKLLAEMRKALKKNSLKYTCKEDDSTNDNLLQLADYVTAFSAKEFKNSDRFKKIRKSMNQKRVVFKVIAH